MGVKELVETIYKKRNRIISRISQQYKKVLIRLEVSLLAVLGSIVNLFDWKSFYKIGQTEVPVQDEERGLTINCMGSVNMKGGRQYKTDLASIAGLLKKADISLAAGVNLSNAKATNRTNRLLNSYGITTLSAKSLVSGQMFVTPMGNVAVITYSRIRGAKTRKKIKLELMRYIQMMKRKKANYIIVYVENSLKKGSISSKEIRLYRLLAQMGADYIVGVTPNRRDGGTTYLKQDGSIARSVYSIGTFLTDNKKLSNKRIVVRLRLRPVQGKLQLFEETYFPYYHIRNNGMVSLLLGNPELLSRRNLRKYRGAIESEMQRIRPANRIITVGKMMGIIGTPLPQKYQHLAEFSVGKICARSFEVAPGDIFFFREPFDDPNDLEEVDPKRRLRIAKTAAQKGALLVMTFQKLPFACRQIICDNVMEAHIAVCAHIRQSLSMRAIGITGSIGKTSTKDMLAEVIKMRYNTVKSERNANVQVKIGVNLQQLTSSCGAYIQEIGGGRPGGASRHARMVLPDVTVVTNIGDAHIGNFGSKEKLMANKLEIIEGMNPDGVLYLNADDPLLATAKPDCNTVFYAVHNKNADYYAENLEEDGVSTTFDIVHGEERVHAKLNVLGQYNVLNAVCCYAIGRQFGISEERILIGLSNFRTSGVRQNLIEVCGRKFFMDCYNASSASVKSALETLNKISIGPDNKRIAVIGDITGMGELTEQVHRDIGKTILQNPVDQIVLFGTSTKFTYDYLKAHGVDARYIPITEREDLHQALRELVAVGDVAAFKGSSKVLLENSVDVTFGTRMTDQRLLDESEYRRITKDDIAYNLFSNYATAVRYSPSHTSGNRVQVADNVGSIPVVNIGRAFYGKSMTEVILPQSIRHIGSEAFMNCRQLSTIDLPASVMFIGNSSFKNCSGLHQVELPEGLLHIGREAFAGCSELERIVIPASVVQIADDAFADCPKCSFVYPEGSYAEAYFTKLREEEDRARITKKQEALAKSIAEAKSDLEVSNENAELMAEEDTVPAGLKNNANSSLVEDTDETLDNDENGLEFEEEDDSANEAPLT